MDWGRIRECGEKEKRRVEDLNKGRSRKIWLVEMKTHGKKGFQLEEVSREKNLKIRGNLRGLVNN